MNWFYLALLAPLLWSFVNHIDKYLLSNYLKSNGIGALVVFSSLAGVLVLPVALIFSSEIFGISFIEKLTLIISGALSAVAILYYFKALFEDETSSVVPFFQTIPVFGLFLGYFFLHETLTMRQLIAVLIIVLGAIILSFRKTEAGLQFKKRAVSFILLSSFLYALYEVLFKFIAVDADFWVSIFWQNLGLLCIGILFVLLNKVYREDFLYLLKNNGKAILGLNVISESFSIIGNIIFAYASLLAPIALVMTVNAYQPLIVFITGVLISSLLPRLGKENLSKNSLIMKVAGIALIVIGSLFINT